MTSITALTYIEDDQIALVPTLRLLDDIDISVVTQTTTAPGWTKFPFIIKYPERRQLEHTLEDDPTISDYTLIDWTQGTGIYYIEHTSEAQLISTIVTEVNGVLTRAKSTSTGWQVELLLPDRASLTQIWEYADDRGFHFEILRLYHNNSLSVEDSYGLTPEQRVALETAFEMGYFDEPRQQSLAELADEMGLSSTAVGGRIRRGIKNLIAATIAEDADSS